MYSVLKGERPKQNKHSITVGENIEAKFTKLKESILNGNTWVPTLQTSRKKPGIEEELLVIMDKKQNGKDEAQYAYLNNQIKRNVWVAKENFLNTKCLGNWRAQRENQTKNLHQEVNVLLGKGRSATTRGNIKDGSGKHLFEKEKYTLSMEDILRGTIWRSATRSTTRQWP